MTTAAHRSMTRVDSTMPLLLTTSTLVVAVLAAVASPMLLPAAGSTLAYVGWSAPAYDVPRGLAYPLMAFGVLMLVVGVATAL
jgi:hypothetical protein